MEKFKGISKITTPTKKRFFGIITLAVVLIIALGAGYYFRFKSNQSHFKKYGLEILDSNYNRIKRQLNNEILTRLSDYPKNDTTVIRENNSLGVVKTDSSTNQVDTLWRTKFEITNLAIDESIRAHRFR